MYTLNNQVAYSKNMVRWLFQDVRLLLPLLEEKQGTNQ